MIALTIFVKSNIDIAKEYVKTEFDAQSLYALCCIYTAALKTIYDTYGKDVVFNAVVNGIKISINTQKIKVKENIEVTANGIIDNIVNKDGGDGTV